MAVTLIRIFGRVHRILSAIRCWIILRPRVTGRLKLRGDTRHIRVDLSFRCDGDLWLGIHSDEGSIVIEHGVSASGPLIVTAIRHLRIGAGALFGPNVLVTDHYHGDPTDSAHRSLPPSQRPLHSPGSIDIGDNTQFGANCVVLAPAAIGSYAIIGANAVVKGDVEPMSVYTGIIGTRSSRNHAIVKELED